MIRKLPQELINKIAAGEVVERPSSVVKELVENSIDAGSTEITVEISPDFIRISDNGHGISPEDLAQLFINHSTSKISAIEDLNNIHTMGFRGEAVATIASVSKMTIASKISSLPVGYIVSPDHPVQTTSQNNGTTVTVKELFYNVPARKKFLKSEPYENRHIIDMVTKISIPHHEISFKLIVKEKVVLNYIRGTLEKRIKDIIPNITLIPIMDDPIISGFISLPKDSFSKTTYQYMYVNNRYISPSSALSKAVFLGYKNALMRGQYPPYVLFITVKPEEVDVNVHPRKIEVRFENEGYIFQKIYNGIQHTLFKNETNIIPNTDTQSNTREIPVFSIVNDSDFATDLDTFTPSKNNNASFTTTYSPKYNIDKAMEFSAEVLQTPQPKNPLDTVDLNSAKQYILSYITTQNAEGMMIFDQHACAERYTFERLSQQLESNTIKTKQLLIPEKVLPQYAEMILEQRSLLSSFGIEIEEHKTELVITHIPEFANLRIVDQLYSDIQNIFTSDLSSVNDLREKIITTIACHSSIRFGDKLSPIECQKIITDLAKCKNQLTCPHGRPTYHILTKERLVEIFKR